MNHYRVCMCGNLRETLLNTIGIKELISCGTCVPDGSCGTEYLIPHIPHKQTDEINNYIRKLEAVVEAAENLRPMMERDFYSNPASPRVVAQDLLIAALAALEESK